MSACEPTQQPMSMVSLVEAIAMYVAKRYDPRYISAGPYLDGYQVQLGQFSVFGDTEDTVIKGVLEHLVESKPIYTEEQLNESLAELEAADRAASEKLIEELAEGGLTALGKATEAARQERKELILQHYNRAKENFAVQGEKASDRQIYETIAGQITDLSLLEMIQVI